MVKTLKVVGNNPEKELDLILVNPPSQDIEDERIEINKIRSIPAYGLGVLATIAKRDGFNVGIIDTESQMVGCDSIAFTINSLNPRIVGFGVNTPMYHTTQKICRNINPEISIVLGGIHPTTLPELTLNDFRSFNLHSIIRGPAEESISAILKGIKKEMIEGASYFDDQGVIIKKPLPIIKRLEDYNFVDRSFFINDPFVEEDKKIDYVLASRGCYKKCTFCSIHASWGQNILFRNEEHLSSEMSSLFESEGVNTFRFLDDLFLVSPGNFQKFEKSLDNLGLIGKVMWYANSRVDVLKRFKDSDLDRLIQSGCRGIGIGIESATQRILEETKKEITVKEAEDVVKRCTERGIDTYCYFIVGFPSETEREIKDTVHFAVHLSQNYGAKCGLNPYKLYPGTADFYSAIGENPSKETIDRIIKFKSLKLVHNADDEYTKNKLQERERFTVIHDPNYFNPSLVEPRIIEESIRDFLLRTISR